jgi:alpha-amylase/alpha-mannosidase (GH57 family)
LSKFERSYLCVYGHFSQPQRGNPLTGEIGLEPAAAPYSNWNEKVADSSIRPNAEAGNFEHISFSFSWTLLNWLKQHAPQTHQTIVSSDKFTPETGGHALATAYHHSILPLARRRDKRTQVRWGIAAFEHHFGRKPLGFWLPEMAVDTETLALLAEAGVQYTVLARKQIRDSLLPEGGGPYKVALPNDQQIGVFVRDDGLSGDISFNIHNLGGAGSWSRHALGPARRHVGPLLLLATAGETFGLHFAGEEQFLYWLVNYEARSAGYEMVTLDEISLKHPPAHPVQIEERSSWSDQQGLANWATGTADGKVDTTWKGGLRRALDNVTSELDRAFEVVLRSQGLDPWTIRDQYAPVLLGEITSEAFVDRHAPKLQDVERRQLGELLRTQELAQRMYSSSTFTDDRLDGRQPRYAIACAAAALSIAQKATSHDLAERLLPDLAVVSSPSSPVSGADILRGVIEELELDLQLAG